jgi:hypothetical protein
MKLTHLAIVINLLVFGFITLPSFMLFKWPLSFGVTLFINVLLTAFAVAALACAFKENISTRVFRGFLTSILVGVPFFWLTWLVLYRRPEFATVETEDIFAATVIGFFGGVHWFWLRLRPREHFVAQQATSSEPSASPGPSFRNARQFEGSDMAVASSGSRSCLREFPIAGFSLSLNETYDA